MFSIPCDATILDYRLRLPYKKTNENKKTNRVDTDKQALFLYLLPIPR